MRTNKTNVTCIRACIYIRMIDKLVLRCRFREIEYFNIHDLDIPLEGAIDGDKRLTMVRHPWERIPSSFAPVAFKVFDQSLNKNPDAYIELKASPAKVMQGHNVFGSDNLRECALALTGAFFCHYPQVADQLDQSTWEVVGADVTFHSRAESVLHAIRFITALGNVCKGQTKARNGFSSTAYFGGKNSRLKKLKIYEKYSEIQQYLKKLLKQPDGELLAEPFTDQLLDYAKGLIRWEATIKKRWFERRNLPTNLNELCKVWDSVSYWKEATKDIRQSLEGKEMKFQNDDEIESALKDKFFAITAKGNKSYTKALNAYRTYCLIRDNGWKEATRMMTRQSFWNHVHMLNEIGLSTAAIQNLHTNGAKIIPLIQYIKVEFGEQIPEWARVA